MGFDRLRRAPSTGTCVDGTMTFTRNSLGPEEKEGPLVVKLVPYGTIQQKTQVEATIFTWKPLHHERKVM